jgi:PiT family inorganic phosphate transporter
MRAAMSKLFRDEPDVLNLIKLKAIYEILETVTDRCEDVANIIEGIIVGVGSSQKMSAVRWRVAGNIVWAWIFTIPASAFVAAIAWWIGTKIL